MKKNKFATFLVLVIAVMFFNLICVKAALPTTLGPITQVGDRVTDNCGEDACYGLALKVSNSTPVICTDYYKTSPVIGSATCEITTDWNENIRYGVAAIINAAKSGISASGITNQYFAAEMAINRFLANKSVGGADIYGASLSTPYRTLYINYLDLANDAYDSYSTDSKVAITLSTSSLTFTLSGSNYVSNNVTVSGVDSYNVTTSVGTVSKSGNTFKVVVPVSSVASTKTVSVTVSSSKSLFQARNYNCGSSYQSVTPIVLGTVSKSASKSLSGTISPKAKLTINKVDSNNAHLKGATIKVTGTKGYSKTFTTTGESIVIEDLEFDTYTITEKIAPSGYTIASSKTVTLSSSNLSGTATITNNKNKVSISKLDATGKAELPGATLEVQDSNGKTLYKWISTTKPYVIEGLAAGKYYLIEKIAPSGYVLNKEKVEFEITASTTTKTVKMTNKLNVVEISKINSVDKKLLAGATLEIQDEKGNIVKYCTDEKGNKNTECKWISTDSVYVIEGFPVGKYYLVETAVPSGYVLNKEKVEFEITASTTKKTVKMTNKLNVVEISKINSVDKKLLPGATLEIQDEKGNIVKYCTDEKGNKNTECKWVSTDSVYEIEGFPVGKYYLVETSAPKGYALNKEKIEFIVDNDKEVIKVEMVNQLEVEVPNTLSSRSALLLSIAMFDIALGVGIVTYVKKNKIKE